MTKTLFSNELFDLQTRITRIISFVVAGCYVTCALFLRFFLDSDAGLFYYLLVFAGVLLANIFVYEIHKKLFITYGVFIILTYSLLMIILLYTGGIESPAVFILGTLPIGAFITSRKQGKIWGGIALVSIIVLYRSESWNIPVTNILPADFRLHFGFICAVFVLFLTTVLSYLIKDSSYVLNKLYASVSKDLEGKNKRLENLAMLVNYSRSIMCVIDIETMCFEELNSYFKTDLGYELAELRGHPITDLFMKKELPEDIREKLKTTSVLRFSTALLTKKGEQKMFSFNATASNGKLYVSASEATNTF